LDDAGEALTEDFVDACRAADIPATEIPPRRALELEGRINPQTRRAVLVPDGTIDAYRLAMRFFASAAARGAVIRNFTEVTSVETQGGKIAMVGIHSLRTGLDSTVRAQTVVNAGGPWADRVASLAGLDVPVTPRRGPWWRWRAG